METKSGNALLLGANDRAMFSMARQLLKKNYRVDVADWQPLPLERSRFIHRYHRLAEGERDVRAFVQDLLAVLNAGKYDLLIPVNDMAVEICVNFSDELRQRVSIVGLPSAESYPFAHDKARLVEKCREIGVPVPASSIVRTLADLDGLPDDLQFPLVLKPAYSRLIKQNRVHTFSVRRVKSRAQMVDAVRELIGSCPVMIQELLAGHGAGFNFLACDGQILSSYAHERVHEPLEGGQSSYRKTIATDKYNLRGHSEKLIREIGWTGIAMIEYRISGGKPYVMEINGRLWGSIELGIFAGVNIPGQMIEHFHEGKSIAGPLPAKQVFVRNLKMDLRSALSKAARQRSPLPAAIWLWSLRHTLSRRELVEDHPLRDFGYESAIYWGWAKKAGMRLKARIFPARLPVNTAKPQLQRGMKVGFLCFGNICRSPFAEAYARGKSPAMEFSSFGFYPLNDRFSPVDAVEAARTFNVDLSSHRSRLLTAEMLETLDVVFVMDKRNLADMGRLFPQALQKTFYLNPEKELSDPYGKSRETFIAIYREIARTIDGFLTPLVAGQRGEGE